MAEDERLREALLELQVLRDREADTLQETKVLLECLEAYSSADTARAALNTVFDLLRDKTGAAQSLLCVQGEGEAHVVAGQIDEIGQTLAPPFRLFSRSRNLIDLHQTGQWSGSVDFESMRGALICVQQAAEQTYALVSFRQAPSTFSKGDMRLAERLVGLAVRAYEGMRVEDENALLAAVIQDSSAGVAIADATRDDQPLIYVNSAFERMTGYSSDEVIGQNCRFMNAEPPDAAVRVSLRRRVSARRGGHFTLRNRRKSGELFWCELTIFPVHDSSGAVSHLVATQTDATERITAQQERDKSRAMMDRVLTQSKDAFLVLDAEHKVAFINAATRESFPAPDLDWAVGSLFSENWSAYLAGSRDMPGTITNLMLHPDLEGLKSNPAGFELDLPDGRSVLLRASPLEDGGVILYSTDVTAMKAAQRLLAQRLAAIEATKDGLAITDETERLVYLNTSAAEFWGYGRASQGLGKKWISRYPDHANVSDEGGNELVLTRMQDDVERTHEITRSKVEQGGFAIVVRDVTERVQNENREDALRASLQQLHRQKSMAELTAGIAHDFNNFLSAINGSATLIDMTPDLPAGVRDHLERIQKAGTQSARMVNRLLDVGAHSEDKGVFALSSAMSDIPSLVAPSLPASVTLNIAPVPPGMVLEGDPGALGQVLFNLILNSKDAMEEAAGHIDVSAEAIEAKEAPTPLVGRLDRNRDYCKITVRDTGAGMPPEIVARVMEPNFSTKGKKGSGLGLAMVAMQLETIGGGVDLDSTLGQGTSIHLYWPIARQTAKEALPEAAQAQDLAGMTIIVVDDEPDVGLVLANYLEALGAEVAVCEDPRDALEAIEDSPEAWSALITDYDMPHMNGGELTEKARAAAPGLPIFVVTALARRLNDPRVTDGQVKDILAKPVDLERLSARVAQAKGS
ncbi:MAG: PAS domain S-box protein [Rhodobacteraceae bacterium]|nr:PAS domain S-box protein [Paracoccaceae bacterium]